MKILYSMIRPGYLRNFEGTLRHLAADGHKIRIVFALKPKLGEERLMKQLARDCPGIGYAEHEKLKGGAWRGLARALRSFVDYLRYLDPMYDKAEKLRERAASRVARPLVLATRFVRSRPMVRALINFFLILERAIPVDPIVDKAVASFAPDIIVVTPLVDLGSYQVDFVKSARKRGIPTALWVASWDNLTNKGLIRLVPDMVAVWNNMQKQEAIELHGVPAESVVVTGATAFDHWFEWRSTVSRQDFCQRVGLDPENPYILYLCSSPFIAPREVDFVEKWINCLRNFGDQRLRRVGVLVRPHPQNVAQWENVDFSRFGNVAIFPRGGENPIDPSSKSNYFDSMNNCAAVVGLNTSALIETGILGRPVFTMLTPEFEGTTEGTLHFHHLLDVNGGLLHLAKDFNEHLAQVAEGLFRGSDSAEKSRGFVRAFVRPHGLDVPASRLLAESVVRLIRKEAPSQTPAWVFAVRSGLWPIAVLLESRRLLKSWMKRNGLTTRAPKTEARPWDPDKDDRPESKKSVLEVVGEDR